MATSRNRFNYDSDTAHAMPSSIPPMPSAVALGKRKESDNECSPTASDSKRSRTASDENERDDDEDAKEQ